MASMGNDVWRGTDEYVYGSEEHTRAMHFTRSVNWDALTAAASKARDGITCRLGDKYTLGHFNLVRGLTFADGVIWVARLRMPTPQNLPGHREALDVQSCMEMEIAVTRLLQQRTTIPVPDIFTYDLTPDNDIGAPYMLMEYIPGNTALKAAQARECQPGVFGNRIQNGRFWEQVADIHAQLASIRFNKVGSIYQQGDSFIIGPDMQSGKGPWKTADDYYFAIKYHVCEEVERDAPLEVLDSDSSHLPKMFGKLIRMYGDPFQEDNFGLVNRDFGAHNLLVDDEFEIIGLIDVGGVMAAPVESVAQLPLGMGMLPTVPGYYEDWPLFLERRKKEQVLIDKYVSMFRERAKEMEPDNEDGKVREVTYWLRSEAASIVQGFLCYDARQLWLNEIWYEAFQWLLHVKPMRKTKDDTAVGRDDCAFWRSWAEQSGASRPRANSW